MLCIYPHVFIFCWRRISLRLRIRATSEAVSVSVSLVFLIGTPTPPHHTQASVSPSFGSGGDTLACGRGRGGPNSDERTDTVVL